MATEQGQVVQLFFNGSCPGNGIEDDRAGYGLVFGYATQNQCETESGWIDHGPDVTAPVANYKALIHGLRTLKKEYDRHQSLRIEVYGDAQSVIRQVTGEYEVNEHHLLEHRREAQSLLTEFDEWSLTYVTEDDTPKLEDADTLADRAARVEDHRGEEQDE